MKIQVPLTILTSLLLSLTVTASSPAIQANTPIELQAKTEASPVLSVEVFEDSEHSIDWQALQNLEQHGKVHWTPTYRLNYGYSRSRYWFRFSVKNIDPSNVRWILELGYPLIQKVSVHIVGADNAVTSSETGRFVPFKERDLEYRTFLFPFQLKRNSVATIYASLESGGTLRAPFRIHSEQSLVPTAEHQSLGLGIYYGAILALVFYNLFIYFALRDRIYLYYVLYASSFAILQGSLSGHAYQYLWPQLVFWNRVSIPFLVGFSFFFLAVFTRALLDTKRTTPRSHHLLTFLMVLSLILMGLSLGDYGITPNKFASIMVSYAPLLVIPSVFLCIKNGSKPAAYYAVAFISFFIGSAAVASKDLGLLPLNFVTLYGMHLGSVIEALLFSLALADRVRILREEKLRNELQIAATTQQLAESKHQLNNERALSHFAAQVAHDIRSPLAALTVLESELSLLPEEKRVMVRSAVNRIRDIANHLLEKNRIISRKPKQVDISTAINTPVETKSVQLVSALLDQIMTEKRIQFRSKIGIEIESNLTPSSYGLFAVVQTNEFKRVISNLINNSVESLGGTGRIHVQLDTHGQDIRIEIRDNGKGIPEEVLPKLMQRGASHDKEEGSGLGLHHAKTTLESWQGKLSLTSEVGSGTTVTVFLPRVPAPDWFVPSIRLENGSAVVILDDDITIHQVWQNRFDSMETGKSLQILHFSTPKELRNWVADSAGSFSSVLYLCDYELLGQNTNGLDLIEELYLQKSAILVTSRYEDNNLRERCEKQGVPLIPKGLAGFVPITITEPKKKVDAILLDDDSLVHMTWTNIAKQNRRSLLSFYRPDDFFEALSEADLNTPIYIDSNLGDGVSGQDLVPQVTRLGFKTVYLTTGYDVDQFSSLNGVTAIVGKEPGTEISSVG